MLILKIYLLLHLAFYSSFTYSAYKYFRFFQHFPLSCKSEYSRSKSIIDAISAKISQLRNFEKNKISQVLIDLTQSTAAKGGDVMKSLRQIGTKILQNPSDPLVDKIIGLAQTK